jgi:hypothetical protein
MQYAYMMIVYYHLHLLPIRSDIAALGEALVALLSQDSWYVSIGSPSRCAAVAVVTAGSG